MPKENKKEDVNSYNAKDITVLEGLEPVTKEAWHVPGYYGTGWTTSFDY